MSKAKNFYFNEVNIEREINPHGLMDFELVTTNTLKLFIDGRKTIDKSSITLTKREFNFPNSIEWNITNKSLYKITLRIEMKNKQGKSLRQFWLTSYTSCTNQVIINYIPEETEKIVITCYHENVINKTAILTITAQN